MKALVKKEIWLEWPMFYLAGSYNDDDLWLDVADNIHFTKNGVIFQLDSKSYDDEDFIEAFFIFDEKNSHLELLEKSIWTGTILTPENKLYYTDFQEIFLTKDTLEVNVAVFKKNKRFFVFLDQDFTINKYESYEKVILSKLDLY